jgi:hypothetical protein
MSDYPGLFGLSGNVDDQSNPYGNLTGGPKSASWAAAAPAYHPMNQFAPNMLPSQMVGSTNASSVPYQWTTIPQNQRPDPQWFQPPPQPPPIQNMNFQGGPQQSQIPINLLQELGQ